MEASSDEPGPTSALLGSSLFSGSGAVTAFAGARPKKRDLSEKPFDGDFVAVSFASAVINHCPDEPQVP